MLSVTRQDAIGFQLDTAIRLWFEDTDRISAHTLACAALGMVHDIATHFGKSCILWDNLPKNLFKAAREAQNFFKHAEKDPSKVLSFNSELTKYHIADALLLYRTLYRSLSSPMATFVLWCAIHEPRVGFEKVTIRFPIGTDEAGLVKLKREQFWRDVRPMMDKAGK